MTKLHATLEILGIRLTEGQERQLVTYVELIDRWNHVTGLVRADADQLISHHVIDALTGLHVVAPLLGTGTGLDLGSGAGIPGIPLAVALPATRWLLVERSQRRSAFIEVAVRTLRLDNAQVLPVDIRQIGQQARVVVCRGVASLAELVRLVTRIGLQGRSCAEFLVAYKGKREVVERELSALPGIAATVTRVTLPGTDAQRHLVTIDLRHPTGRTA